MRFMSRFFCSTILLVLLFLTADAQAATFRVALILGNNEGNPGQIPLRYAEQDARNLQETLVQIGGFPADRVKLLLGKRPETVLEAVKTLRSQALHLVKNPQDQLLLLFYFSGHSEGGFLEMGDSQMEFLELRDEIRRIPSAIRLFALDTCRSGDLIRSKGGTPAPSFQADFEEGGLPKGEVLMTSSTSLENSHESSELQGSFFTHYLISALRGGADFNHDGRVSLMEAYSYTSEKTSQKASSHRESQHPLFSFDISGGGELFLTDSAAGGVPSLGLAPGDSGRFLIYSKKRGNLIAEIDKSPGEPFYIALPKGELVIRRERGNNVLEQDFLISGGGIYRFNEEDSRRVRASRVRRILSYSEIGGNRRGVLLREGELIKLALRERLSTKTSQPGEKIRLEAAEDLFVGDRLVIRGGSMASGEVLAAQSRRAFADGEIVFRIGYVQAVDGQWVPLESIISRNPSGFWFPLLPFLGGRHAVLEEGTIFEAYVSRDVKIR